MTIVRKISYDKHYVTRQTTDSEERSEANKGKIISETHHKYYMTILYDENVRHISYGKHRVIFFTGTPPKSSKCQPVSDRLQKKLECQDWYPP